METSSGPRDGDVLEAAAARLAENIKSQMSAYSG
jgi:hypothetical protein